MLANPTNGSVSIPDGNEIEDEAVYSCDPGFELSGNSRRCCRSSGSWSGTAPTCVQIGRSILRNTKQIVNCFDEVEWYRQLLLFAAGVCCLVCKFLRDVNTSVLTTTIKNNPIRNFRICKCTKKRIFL